MPATLQLKKPSFSPQKDQSIHQSCTKFSTHDLDTFGQAPEEGGLIEFALVLYPVVEGLLRRMGLFCMSITLYLIAL